MSEAEYAIQAQGVNKAFGGVKALSDINLSVKPHTIHCVVGENGAGKSTLMKIFSGVLNKDSGEIRVDDVPVSINTPKDSTRLGIGIIYQEFVLAPDMSVAENIFLDDLGEGGLLLNWRRLNARAREIIESFGFHIDPRAKVGNLSVAYMQIVEIAKALAKKVKVLILDEPTAVLSEPEIKILFRVLRSLKESGVTIIYISHRLEEVFEIADEITVLKDGKCVITAPCCDFDKPAIIKYMTGRDMKDMFPPRVGVDKGEELLRAEGVCQKNIIRGIDLAVHRGEVVGIAGLVGSGRTEFARTLFGMDRQTGGKVSIRGRHVKLRVPRDAIKHGVGLVPENRKDQGLILGMSIAENLTAVNMRSVTKWRLVLDRSKENKVADSFVDKLQIKRYSNRDAVSNLSGGNQQKVVLAKWLYSGCDVLILDEPTRGVDVGAKYEIYKVINDLAAAGYGILVISSEITEIIGLCDKAYVFSEGRVKGVLTGGEMTEERIMHLAIPTRKAVEAV